MLISLKNVSHLLHKSRVDLIPFFTSVFPPFSSVLFGCRCSVPGRASPASSAAVVPVPATALSPPGPCVPWCGGTRTAPLPTVPSGHRLPPWRCSAARGFLLKVSKVSKEWYRAHYTIEPNIPLYFSSVIPSLAGWEGTQIAWPWGPLFQHLLLEKHMVSKS